MDYIIDQRLSVNKVGDIFVHGRSDLMLEIPFETDPVFPATTGTPINMTARAVVFEVKGLGISVATTQSPTETNVKNLLVPMAMFANAVIDQKYFFSLRDVTTSSLVEWHGFLTVVGYIGAP